MSNKSIVDWLENKLAENLKNIVLTQDHDLMTSIFQEARKMEQDKLEQIRNAAAEILLVIKKHQKD